MYQAPILKTAIVQYLPDNPIIVEAGAHIGRDTVKMAKLWPLGTIYAFEPVKELFEQLTKNTQEFHHVQVFNKALSDHTGTEVLHVSSGASTAASSFFEPHDYAQCRPEVTFSPQEVQTITLDEWAKKNTVLIVDFLWLDMQGAELKVLKAAPHILSTVSALLLEVSLTERFKGNPLYDEVKHWIEAQGFVVVQQDIPRHDKINLLCIRKEIA